MYLYQVASRTDLLHYGKGHDDNPPGRGSGRYAWGSGKEGGRERKVIPKRPFRTQDGFRVTGKKYTIYNGELTEHGKKKVQKAQTNSKYAAKEKRRASKILQKDLKDQEKLRKKLSKQTEKSNRQIEAGRRIYGDEERKREAEFKNSVSLSDVWGKTLSDIQSEKIKAGKDYITEKTKRLKVKVIVSRDDGLELMKTLISDDYIHFLSNNTAHHRRKESISWI